MGEHGSLRLVHFVEEVLFLRARFFAESNGKDGSNANADESVSIPLTVN